MKHQNTFLKKETFRFQDLFLILVFGIYVLPISAQNTNYISNKKPLVSTPFIALPLGAIQSKGWLETQLKLQKDGLTGNAEAIYSELGSNSAWLGGDAPDSNWERPPYYVKGLVVLAYSLNDTELKTKAQKWIDWTLNSQQNDGSFGPKTNDDWWPRMPMLSALTDYYEATNDKRVIPFLTKYFDFQFKTLDNKPLIEWGKARAADNVEVIVWLYNRTEDTFLLALIDKIKSQTYDFTTIFSENTFITGFTNNFFPKHSVNVAQAYKYGPVFYQKSKDKRDKNAFVKGANNLSQYHTQITGMNSGTEMLAGNASVQGVELCATVERMFSNEIATRILGDASIGDELEKIALNQLPATLSDDFHQHQYYALPNQVQSKKGRNGFAQDYDNAIIPGPFSGFPCCRFNWHMGWPKYAQYSWMATADNGLVVTSYVPSKVTAKVANGQDITIHEETNYPFEEQIRFRISTDKDVSFPLKLRIPSWCAAPVVKVNGKIQKNVISGTYYSIYREWKHGDMVTLDVPMEIKISNWVNNSVGVERGPLIYSLKMDEDWKKINHYDYKKSDFSEYEVLPKNNWNYGLIFDAKKPENSFEVVKKPMPKNPFVLSETPVQLKVKAKKVNSWRLDPTGIHATEPPISPIASNEVTEEITLIPFGAERIRVTYFPVIGIPKDNKQISFKDNFKMAGANKWVNFGGSWQQQKGKYYAHATAVKGMKSIATATNFSNFTFTASIRIEDDNSEGGMLFRVHNASDGADIFQGYYLGLSTSGHIILGKSDYAWNEIKTVDYAIEKKKKYNVKVVAKESLIQVFVEDMKTPKIVVEDPSFQSGAIGLRAYGGETVIFEKVAVKL